MDTVCAFIPVFGRSSYCQTEGNIFDKPPVSPETRLSYGTHTGMFVFAV